MEQLNRPGQTKTNTRSLTALIKILDEYSYADRPDMAELIRDNLQFDDRSITERFLTFVGSVT